MNSIEAQKQLTDRELIIFNSELDRKRKSTAIAYIVYFLLGTLGGHKFYIGKPIIGLWYILLFLGGCFLMMDGSASGFDPSMADDPSAVLGSGFLSLGLLGIMLLLDLFTIPGQIKKQEDRVRNDLLVKLVSK